MTDNVSSIVADFWLDRVWGLYPLQDPLKFWSGLAQSELESSISDG